MTATQPAAARSFIPDSRALPVLGWAAFLGASWTWCIGMFLPVLLVREFGTWGWVAFAVPNVIGAAAMGWVLQRPGASERLTAAHGPAAVCFSVVTILFHGLFVTALVPSLVGIAGPIIAIAVAAAVYVGAVRWQRGSLVVSAAVLAVSTAAFIITAIVGGIDGPISEPIRNLPTVGLAGVCFFGFAFCPYLDLTFHRARRCTVPIAAAAAFTLGFGVLFLLMIVFTLVYAPWLVGGRGAVMPRGVAWAVGMHMSVQSGLTVAFHAREVMDRYRAERSAKRGFGIGRGIVVGFACAAFAIAGGAALGSIGRYTARGTGPFEMAYRMFMAFYGLAFPAYVWICMSPGWHSGGPLSAAKIRVFLVAILLAAPGYWMAFIELRMLWVLPSLALLLIARPMVSRLARRSRAAGA